VINGVYHRRLSSDVRRIRTDVESRYEPNRRPILTGGRQLNKIPYGLRNKIGTRAET
jgi:hypothetical protein